MESTGCLAVVVDLKQGCLSSVLKYLFRSIVNVHVVITKTTQTARATENPIIHSDICFEDSTNFSVIRRILSLYLLQFCSSVRPSKQLPLNLSHVWFIQCSLHAYRQFSPYDWSHSIVQLEPIQPTTQEHSPSVCRHVLQLGKQTLEQFPP